MSKRDIKALASSSSEPSPFKQVNNKLAFIDQRLEKVKDDIKELERLKENLELSREATVVVLDNIVPTDPPLYGHNIRVTDVVQINNPSDPEHKFIGVVKRLTEQRVFFQNFF